MRSLVGFVLTLTLFSSPCLMAVAANTGNPAYTDPAKADDDFAFQGEYVGEITHDGQPMRFGAQIVALGDGTFGAVAYPGGLPGDGWTPPNKITGKCGGVYSVAAPSVNMCLPPLQWQTYDIEFTGPRFDGGKKTANPRLTVRHNGVVIQDNVEVPKITPGGPQKQEKPVGPLHLQNHDNPVRYRNVWFLPQS